MTAVRHALRNLRFRLGTSVVVVLTLALGIAACAAVFGLVNATLLRDLPFRDADRLVWIENSGTGGMSSITSRVDTVLEWREYSRSLESIAAYFAFFDYEHYTITDGSEPLRLRGVRVSQNFLDVLGIQPFVGRNFTREEADWNDGRTTAVLLSHAFWRQRFGGDDGVVGTTVALNDGPATVVGVLPQTFDFASVFAPASRIDVLVPFPLVEQTARWGATSFGIGRLAPGATRMQAQHELDAINDRLNAAGLQDSPGARVTMLADHIRGGVRTAFFALAAAVACVMLIACVNVSSLLLARSNARQQEVSVRTALGATRWHLLRQMLIENSMLTLAGCVLGMALAWTMLRGLAGAEGLGIPLIGSSSLDAITIVFTLAVAALAAGLATALPASQLWRHSSSSMLRGGAAGSGTRVIGATPKTLVVMQIALTCLLLVAAGLLVRSFVDVLRVDLGFKAENTIAWRADTSRSFASEADRVAYFERLLTQTRTLPGIESAGYSDTLPLGRNREWGIAAKDVQYAPGEAPTAGIRIINDHYLQTVQVPLLAGRYFDARDHADSAPTVILGRTAAEVLWPGQDPLGRMARVGGDEYTVIGIVADVPRAIEATAQADVYLNYRQSADWMSMELIVRSARSPETIIAEVRAAIAAFDPAMASNEYTTLAAVVDQAIAPRRLTTLVLGGFSVFALLLAAIGLYGTIAYSVSRRTREMGVRMALGARARSVLVLVLGEGARLTALGIVIGLAAAMIAGRLMESLLFGVAPSDPLTFAVNALIVTAIALVATLLPAVRAARTQPMEALRHG